ncbi:DUF6127 family protein [Novosphingobium colocasiae]
MLALIGLDDESAPHDVSELRELLQAWRDAKASARVAAIGWIVRAGLALLLLGLAVRLGGRRSCCDERARPRSAAAGRGRGAALRRLCRAVRPA